VRKTTCDPTTPQQPEWADPLLVSTVRAELAARPPLVGAEEVRDFAEVMGKVAGRDAVVVQGGDCAERFLDANPGAVRRKLGQLDSLAGLVGARTGLETVRVGRLAGQYAKPRSSDWELLPDGSSVPSYRGDAVNDPVPGPVSRAPDPMRLLDAYDHARLTLTEVDRHNADRPSIDRFYVSHEALLLDYERPLVRDTPAGAYASSGHFIWVGDRTRDRLGPHLDLAADVTNCVGVKIGPSVSPDEAVLLSHRLNPHGLPGRLVFIVRLGADAIEAILPELVSRTIRCGAPVVWLCDPMHGNTVRTGAGHKTRPVESILAETGAFVRILREHQQWPAGIHLEMTPDDVVECVRGTEPAALRYRSACDPRLNAAQAVEVVRRFAELL
jgi:3-deoxy-7-phosphoheptulonate synthase